MSNDTNSGGTRTMINNRNSGSEPMLSEIDPEPTSILSTFTLDVDLPNGVCILRKLSNDIYELMNLSSSSHKTLSSKESGRLLAEDSGRVAALTISPQEWTSLQRKAEHAILSANRRIFRFLDVPIEIRMMIYKIALVHLTGSLKNYKRSVMPRAKSLALSLMETCHRVYQECRRVFYQNSLEINNVFRWFKPLLHTFQNNLQNVTFSWWAFAKKDSDTLKFFTTCEQLRILNIRVTKYVVASDGHKPQKTFQSEMSIAKFSRASGFDSLMLIRGLEKVTVQRDLDVGCSEGKVSEIELQTFQDFLMVHLTQPKYLPPLKPRKKSARQIAQEKSDRKFDERQVNQPAFSLPSTRPTRHAATTARQKNQRLIMDAREHDSEEEEEEEE